MIELNDEQTEVNNIVIEKLRMSHHEQPTFCRDPFNYIIGGYAGTGKTTLLAYLRKEIYKSFPKLTIAFATFTGKASSVLKSKLPAICIL